jgi:hypothetical protein
VNEIQIIQSQLATERAHFAEVANACAAALDRNNFIPGGELALACAEYFAFAATRISASPTSPGATAGPESWRHFLRGFIDASTRHFAAIDTLLTQNLPVTEWRARSGIDADSIFTERAHYARVKAAVS